MPEEAVVYFGDQAHIPYGPRPLQQVRDFSEGITRFLLDKQTKLIVVACNAASAAALSYLRSTFPKIPFVGMEPAIKPAAERTETGVVGILATPATFQGELFASVVEQICRRCGASEGRLSWIGTADRGRRTGWPKDARNPGKGASTDVEAKY